MKSRTTINSFDNYHKIITELLLLILMLNNVTFISARLIIEIKFRNIDKKYWKNMASIRNKSLAKLIA